MIPNTFRNHKTQRLPGEARPSLGMMQESRLRRLVPHHNKSLGFMIYDM